MAEQTSENLSKRELLEEAERNRAQATEHYREAFDRLMADDLQNPPQLQAEAGELLERAEQLKRQAEA